MHNTVELNSYPIAFKDGLASVIKSRITHNLVFIALITTVTYQIFRSKNNLLGNATQFLQRDYINGSTDIKNALKRMEDDCKLRYSFDKEKIPQYRLLIQSIKDHDCFDRFKQETQKQHQGLYIDDRLSDCYNKLRTIFNSNKYDESDHLSFLVVILSEKHLRSLESKINKDINMCFFLLVVLIVGMIAYNLII